MHGKLDCGWAVTHIWLRLMLWVKVLLMGNVLITSHKLLFCLQETRVDASVDMWVHATQMFVDNEMCGQFIPLISDHVMFYILWVSFSSFWKEWIFIPQNSFHCFIYKLHNFHCTTIDCVTVVFTILRKLKCYQLIKCRVYLCALRRHPCSYMLCFYYGYNLYTKCWSVI